MLDAPRLRKRATIDYYKKKCEYNCGRDRVTTSVGRVAQQNVFEVTFRVVCEISSSSLALGVENFPKAFLRGS